MLAKLELYGIIIAVALLTAFGWGQYMKHEGRMEERQVWEAKQAEAAKVDLEALTGAVNKSNEIAGQTLTAIQKGKARSVIDRGVIQREINTNTIYASDCFAPTGLVQWNALSAGRAIVQSGATESQPNARVPEGSSTTSSRQQGRNPLVKPPSGKGNIR